MMDCLICWGRTMSKAKIGGHEVDFDAAAAAAEMYIEVNDSRWPVGHDVPPMLNICRAYLTAYKHAHKGRALTDRDFWSCWPIEERDDGR